LRLLLLAAAYASPVLVALAVGTGQPHQAEAATCVTTRSWATVAGGQTLYHKIDAWETPCTTNRYVWYTYKMTSQYQIDEHRVGFARAWWCGWNFYAASTHSYYNSLGATWNSYPDQAASACGFQADLQNGWFDSSFSTVWHYINY
jgi:hypothetical protein